MARTIRYGQLARYSASPPTLTDKAATCLQVSSAGVLATTVTGAAGGGQGVKGKKYGQPARYNNNQLTLTDGAFCALQVDVNGNLVIA